MGRRRRLRQWRTAGATSDRTRRCRAFAPSSVGDREYRDQQPERLVAFVEGGESGDLPQLVLHPAACDQDCGHVRRAQPARRMLSGPSSATVPAWTQWWWRNSNASACFSGLRA